jgi:hypothetical protein
MSPLGGDPRISNLRISDGIGRLYLPPPHALTHRLAGELSSWRSDLRCGSARDRSSNDSPGKSASSWWRRRGASRAARFEMGICAIEGLSRSRACASCGPRCRVARAAGSEPADCHSSRCDEYPLEPARRHASRRVPFHHLIAASRPTIRRPPWWIAVLAFPIPTMPPVLLPPALASLARMQEEG